jgi:hypothetical protein
MSGLHQQVGDLLAQNQWAFGIDDTTKIFCFKVRIDDVAYPVEIEAQDESLTLATYLTFLPKVPVGRKQAMLDFMSIANFAATSGGLEMDPNSRYVRYRNGLRLQGIGVTAEFIENFVMRHIRRAMNFKDTIRAILYGYLPGDAMGLVGE